MSWVLVSGLGGLMSSLCLFLRCMDFSYGLGME